MAAVVVSALCADSLREIGILKQGATLDASNGAFVLGRFNQLADNWNAQKECVWAEEFKSFTFVANQQDYTIGPSGADFTVTHTRPVAIDGANVVLPTDVNNPINIRDWQWWLGLPLRTVNTTFPTDLYYEPSWPNGILHFWPKPNTAYDLELVIRNTLAQVVLTDSVTFPPGYQNALMLTLAEDIAPAYGADLSQTTVNKAREARARIYRNNDFTPTIQTFDPGMPSHRRNASNWNYKTGLFITNS